MGTIYSTKNFPEENIMCGILAVIGSKNLELAQTQASKLSHRGPDERDSVSISTYPGGAILCHERLSIMDLSTGKQPIQGTRENYVIHNGEIYNHQELRKACQKAYP